MDNSPLILLDHLHENQRTHHHQYQYQHQPKNSTLIVQLEQDLRKTSKNQNQVQDDDTFDSDFENENNQKEDQQYGYGYECDEDSELLASSHHHRKIHHNTSTNKSSKNNCTSSSGSGSGASPHNRYALSLKSNQQQYHQHQQQQEQNLNTTNQNYQNHQQNNSNNTSLSLNFISSFKRSSSATFNFPPSDSVPQSQSQSRILSSQSSNSKNSDSKNKNKINSNSSSTPSQSQSQKSSAGLRNRKKILDESLELIHENNDNNQQKDNFFGDSVTVIEDKPVPVPGPGPEPVRRMSLFRAFTRRNNSQSKHKKLNEGGWMVGDGVGGRGSSPGVVQGVTFYVKFLGSALMEKVGSVEAAEATKTVIGMVKAGKKSFRVGLTVSSSGIRIVNGNTGELTSFISIYDIAHCSSDANYPNVFSFIATNKNETNECYCFASPKRKMAQKVTLTIAEAFNLAFEIWQNSCVGGNGKQSHLTSSEKKRGEGGRNSGKNVVVGVGVGDAEERQWVHFDEEDEELDGLNDHLENIHLRTYSINRQRRQDSLEDHDPAHHSDHEDLLICLH